MNKRNHEQWLGENGEYFTRQVIESLLHTNPLWYLDAKILALTSFIRETEIATSDWPREQTQLLDIFATALKTGAILLGGEADGLGEGYNDDDRWGPEYFGKKESIEKPYPDIIVVHHTATKTTQSISEKSLWELEALGLLRLYVPESGLYIRDKEKKPIASGHFRNGKQTFIGYHHLIAPDGSSLQTLGDEATAFHAGNYMINCRSIGVAFLGNFTAENTKPTKKAMTTFRSIVQKYQKPGDTIQVMGHNEILPQTPCPGAFWTAGKTRR